VDFADINVEVMDILTFLIFPLLAPRRRYFLIEWMRWGSARECCGKIFQFLRCFGGVFRLFNLMDVCEFIYFTRNLKKLKIIQNIVGYEKKFIFFNPISVL